MNRYFLFLIVVFVVINSAYNQTIITGGYISGTWAQTGSPYQVFGDITIHHDSSLIIEPGVVIEFQGLYMLSVKGDLYAIGTESDRILFTINDTTGFNCDTIEEGGWRGISISNGGYANIVFSIVQYKKGINQYDYAAIALYSGNMYLANSIIANNKSAYGGGLSFYMAYNSVYILNNIIINNSAILGGGIYASENSTNSIIISGNTICNNIACYGGGINCGGYPGISFSNSIIFGNIDSLGHQIQKGYGIIEFGYCDIEGGTSGIHDSSGEPDHSILENCISVNPEFVAPSTGAGATYDGLSADWSLLSTSPCINGGTPDTTGLNLPMTDLSGNNRLVDCIIDIGAYEYQDTVITIFDPLPDVCESTPAFELTTGFPGGTYTGPGVTGNIFDPAVAGAGIHTIGFSSGCDTTVLTQNIQVLPAPDITFLYDTIHTGSPDTVLLDAGPGAASYLWQDNSTSQTFSVSTYGWYTVTVTSYNACTGTDSVFVTWESGVIDNSIEKKLTVFPNPSDGIIYLKTDNIIPVETPVEIYDIYGKQVYKNVFYDIPVIKIDLSGMAGGLYLAVVRSDNKLFYRKFILY